MTRFRTLAAAVAGLACIGPAWADDCLNPDALGVSRLLTVDPAMFARVGTVQYAATLPLGPKEVVLTFDDGPMPPMTTAVLNVLQNDCLRATFFLIGRNAKAHPGLVRWIAEEGHTLANHSENHHLVTLAGPHGIREFDKGFSTIAAALAPSGHTPAPFFRFPGLLNTHAVEGHARTNGVSVMSADVLADDWIRIGPDQIIARAMTRLGQKGSGILLLHDVQPALALALPRLLRELKKQGYRIVHLVPAPGAGAPPPPPTETLTAEKKPTSAPVVRRTAARAAAKPAEPEPVEAFTFASWRKKFVEQNGEKAAAVIPLLNGGH